MMTDADHARYEAMYAADMRAEADIECCEVAGAELIHSGNGMWRWKCGDVSSYDIGKGSGFFETKDEAADHFTHSEVFYAWLRSRGVNV